MWLFKPVFIDGFGSRYLQRRDSPEASIADRAWVVIKTLAGYAKPLANWASDKWLTHGWPLVKNIVPMIKGLLSSLKK